MKKRTKKKWIRVLAGILLTLVVILLVLAGVVIGLRIRGRQLLMESVRDMPAIDLGVSGDSVAIEQVGQENARMLKPGEVIYKDKLYAFNRDVLCILLMGIDKKDVLTDAKDGIDGGQADGLFLLVFNPHNKVYSILTINRNTMTDIDVFGRDGSYITTKLAQITLQHGYGDGKEESCERQIRTVSRFMHNIPIHAYASLNVAAVPALNDAVGGVTVTVLEDVAGMKAGEEVTLMGKQAYNYVQNRDINVFDSNTGRFNRQKQYINAFVQKLRGKLKENPGFALDMYNIATDYMVTDIDISRVTYMATEFMGYTMNEKGIMSVPGEVIMGVGFEEFYADDDAVKDLVVELFYEPVGE